MFWSALPRETCETPHAFYGHSSRCSAGSKTVQSSDCPLAHMWHGGKVGWEKEIETGAGASMQACLFILDLSEADSSPAHTVSQQGLPLLRVLANVTSREKNIVWKCRDFYLWTSGVGFSWPKKWHKNPLENRHKNWQEYKVKWRPF